MKEILVVGGAGYIGSHMCKYLHKNGMKPVVLDNLSYGHRQAVQWGPFYKGEMADATLLKKIFASHKIEAVMHFAAFCYVGESVEAPLKYYQNNISATLTLLAEMVEHNILNFIFLPPAQPTVSRNNYLFWKTSRKIQSTHMADQN